jgi:hypothetical protein
MIKSRNTTLNQKTAFTGNTLMLMVIAVMLTLSLCGCGDFFAKKPTEIESRKILEDLSEIREIPSLKNPMPEYYTRPAERMNIKGGVKLFYFTKHHPVATIAELVTQQMGNKIIENSRSNQIIIYCKDDSDADKVLEYLEMVDVPPIQVNIDCLILERFGDVTMDWETSIMVENFLGEGVTLGEQRGTFDDNGILEGLEPAFPGASLREQERAAFGLDFGYWIDRDVAGHQVRALVDVLVSRGYLKILLNPTLEVINGKTATVTIKDYAPIEQVRTGTGGQSDVYSITEYKWVEDTLTVTPSVFANGFIGLKTQIKVGSRSKPEGVTQRAIITERSIDVLENRIKPGHSLIIGGMRKSEKRSVIRGVPFFKDIPIIGVLFSSKDYEEKGTEIIFILTPTISSGGRDTESVFASIKKKHSPYTFKTGFGDVIGDPLGAGIYTEMIEENATEAEAAKNIAELERADAQRIAEAQKEKALQLKQKAEEKQALVEVVKTETAKAIAEADSSKAQVASVKAATQKAQQDLQAAKGELKAQQDAAQKLQKELEAAKAELAQEQARKKAEAEKARKDVEAAKIAAEKAAAQKAAQEAAHKKAEAEAAKIAAEKAAQEAKRQEQIKAGQARKAAEAEAARIVAEKAAAEEAARKKAQQQADQARKAQQQEEEQKQQQAEPSQLPE